LFRVRVSGPLGQDLHDSKMEDTSRGWGPREGVCRGRANLGGGEEGLALLAILSTIKLIWRGGKRSKGIFWQITQKNRGFLAWRNICGGT
jgi:hypothetical protein